MNDKIKDLSQKIRKEGYEKAQDEARQLMQDAKREAEEIRKNAKLEAESFLTKAKGKANRYTERVNADLKLSVEQILVNLRKDIGDMLLTKVIDEPLERSMNNSEFVANLIEDAVRNWKECNSDAELEILLSADAYTSVIDHFSKDAQRWFSNGIELKTVSGLGAGFEIQPQNGHYKICMTDEAFNAFLKESLRPIAHQFLFKGK